MDPSEVLNELHDLTEIEEMLVAQVFSMILAYRLVKVNIDIVKMSKNLLRHLPSLDVLVIHH
jgi:hypothetical protein